MEITKFKHENVRHNGTFEDGQGSVETDGVIRMSQGEGCGLPGCLCSEGNWISITAPRNENGIVEGILVEFTKEEMKDFFRFHICRP